MPDYRSQFSKKKVLTGLCGNEYSSKFLNKFADKKSLRILAYHRVYDIDEDTYQFDNEIISSSVSDFDKQMKFVSNNFNVLNFHDLSMLRRNGEKVPDNSLIITFDDGYLDNYTNAFPVLKQYGLTAVFFVSTRFIGSELPFWFDFVVGLVKSGVPLFEHRCLMDFFPNHFGSKSGSDLYVSVRDYMMSIPNSDRAKICNIMYENFITGEMASQVSEIKAMSWDHLREMHDAGMEIGSHTRGHAILNTCTDESAHDEIAGSMEDISRQLDSSVVSISYPVGNQRFFPRPDIIRLVQEVGYQWGIGYVSGTQQDFSDEPFSLKRLKIERYVDMNWFRTLLLFPALLVR